MVGTLTFVNRTLQTRPEGAFSSKLSERWEKALRKSNEMQKQTNKQESKRKYATNPDNEQFLVTVKSSLYSKLN